MSDQFADIGQAPVIAYQRNFSSTNVDHIKETSDAGMIGHTDLQQDNTWIPVDGFPNGFSNKIFQSNHDIGADSSSGIKRHKNSHHDHSKHHRKQSYHRHHRRSTNGILKKTEQKRFCRTASALKQAGLLQLTLQTAQLIQENKNLQKEIDSLQQQTLEFSKSIQEQLEEKVKNSKQTDDSLS